MDAGVGGSICRNGQIQLNASVDNTYSPYKIKWVSSSGLLDPVTGLPSDSILNPVASPPLRKPIPFILRPLTVVFEPIPLP